MITLKHANTALKGELKIAEFISPKQRIHFRDVKENQLVMMEQTSIYFMKYIINPTNPHTGFMTYSTINGNYNGRISPMGLGTYYNLCYYEIPINQFALMKLVIPSLALPPDIDYERDIAQPHRDSWERRKGDPF